MDIDIKQQIKELLLKENISMTDLVELLNNRKLDIDNRTTIASLNNKLTRGSIKYSEILEIFDALGYDIVLQKQHNADTQSAKSASSGYITKSYKPLVTGTVAGLATGGLWGGIIGSALGMTWGKSGTTKDSKDKNIITGDDILKNAKEFEKENGYNPIPTDEELHEMAQMQERLNLELDIEYNIISILDNIVLNCDPSISEKYKNDIENYMKYAIDEFSLGFKLLPAYRLVCNILTLQSNSDSIEILRFLTKLRNLYSHGGLLDLSDDELKNLNEISTRYRNILAHKVRD